MQISIFLVGLAFLGMGMAAFWKPSFILGIFGGDANTPCMRNEVRGVYGGFGVTMAFCLIFINFFPLDVRQGLILGIALALFGMAAGRLIGFILERTKKWPVVFLLAELVGAVALMGAL